METLTEPQLRDSLVDQIGQKLSANFCFELKTETVSTNDDVRRAGRAGAEEGLVICSDHQTAGRGRRGDEWESPPGKNLLFSILLRPSAPIDQWNAIPHLAGLAIARGIEAAFPEVDPIQIKWPNDLYLGGKKLGGILLESELFQEPSNNFCVLGAGINVNIEPSDFPPSIQGIATTLFESTERIVSRSDLLASILAEWSAIYPQSIVDFESVVPELLKRSFLQDREVEIILNDSSVAGIVVGLGKTGELLVKTKDGEIQSIVSAENVRF